MKKNITFYFPPINKLGNVAFRRLCNNSGADFVFTEMVRAEKVIEGELHQINKLKIPKDMQDKTIVQIICEDINNIEKSVDKIVELCPNLKEINYNMGCPQSTMSHNECGGGIVKNPAKVKEVSTKLQNACKKYGVIASVKIRLGIDRENITIYENVKNMKEVGIGKVYIHGRTLKDGYIRPATFEEIKEVKIQNPDLEIIANGDIKYSDKLNEVINETNCDGVLIGRAALENPYVFNELKEGRAIKNHSGIKISERIQMIKELLEYGQIENLEMDYLKQNIVYLTKGVILGNEFRKEINQVHTYKEVFDICDNFS